MAVKVKDLITFLQKHKTEDWVIACLEFDDYHGLWASLYNNETEVPNKTSYFDAGPAHEWDSMFIKTDEELRDANIEYGHEDDVFE